MSHISTLSRFGVTAAALLTLSIAIACGSGDDDATATTEPTPTQPAASLTATASANASATPTTAPATTPTSTAVTPTATPSNGTPTATPGGGGETPTPVPPTAGPTSTPIPFQNGGNVLNVTEGTLTLTPGSGSAVEFPAEVNVENFKVSVTFANPFHPDTSPWDYGIKFRQANGEYEMLVFDEKGNLSYLTGSGFTADLVSSTDIPSFRTAAGNNNKITILVLEETARIFLDGALVHTMEVGRVGVSGDISLVTDIQNRTEIQGASVRFTSFFIDRAALIAQSESGSLVKPSSDEPAIGEQSRPTSVGYATVTLTSPAAAFSADYSYGIKLTAQSESGFDNWLVFDDTKAWQHIRKAPDGEESVVASGTASLLDTREGFSNTIELISVDGQRKVYLNGQALTVMTLVSGDAPYTIVPFAGFLPTHQPGGMATQYSNFTVCPQGPREKTQGEW